MCIAQHTNQAAFDMFVPFFSKPSKLSSPIKVADTLLDQLESSSVMTPAALPTEVCTAEVA